VVRIGAADGRAGDAEVPLCKVGDKRFAVGDEGGPLGIRLVRFAFPGRVLQIEDVREDTVPSGLLALPADERGPQSMVGS
jgi:hypothetical protein